MEGRTSSNSIELTLTMFCWTLSMNATRVMSAIDAGSVQCQSFTCREIFYCRISIVSYAFLYDFNPIARKPHHLLVWIEVESNEAE